MNTFRKISLPLASMIFLVDAVSAKPYLNIDHKQMLWRAENPIQQAQKAPDLYQPDDPELTQIILKQIRRCWVVDPASSAAKVVLSLAFSLDANSEIIEAPSLLYVNGENAAAQSIAFDSARRAILRCGADGFGARIALQDQEQLDLRVGFDFAVGVTTW